MIHEFRVVQTGFLSGGFRCGTDLYLPDGAAASPLVIMAHGFGGERTFRLPAYAEHFARNGIAVLLFDYRTFGDSEGEPRNLVDPDWHIADWKAAIAHARTIPDIDKERIALWGTSYSGGHCVVCAAQDAALSAIVVQVPFSTRLARSRTLAWRTCSRPRHTAFLMSSSPRSGCHRIT